MAASTIWDVVVVGAGLSGIIAAQRLARLGCAVLVVDKSRGLGGRLATRRVLDQRVDHGCRFLDDTANPELSPVPALIQAGVLQSWQPLVFHLQGSTLAPCADFQPCWVAPQGMTTVAKVLAQNLTIWQRWQATQITPQGSAWTIDGLTPAGLTPAEHQPSLTARAVILAIPAPQIVPLVQKAAAQNSALQGFMAPMANVLFDPVMTMMAGYPPSLDLAFPLQTAPPAGWMVYGQDHPTLAWAGLDSGKRVLPGDPVVVMHSTPGFAQAHLDAANLDNVGQQLLASVAPQMGPGLTTPTWMQVHRWRYGLVRQPLGGKVLSTPDLPTLIGCGDWCRGKTVEAAIASGHDAAEQIMQVLP
ncbi:NAD(P)-binding protein [Nodosilinea sp. P-1105]|uniref:NAD(P)/FAD-dependent oxidoreductase n=1 Tax=Nodosilinea sp. P-1105 TaxID=2546229 RepID=UPI00146D7160|nr:NAD(P)-binding protein [Nodosilinea sp. P-1105]NMF85639.1 FAD-dependent oxidoreductase [Nodosilinea sp. P-1105]